MEECGKICIIHPVRFEKMKVKNGMVQEESKEYLYSVCKAFVWHHAKFNCRNYNKNPTLQSAPTQETYLMATTVTIRSNNCGIVYGSISHKLEKHKNW